MDAGEITLIVSLVLFALLITYTIFVDYIDKFFLQLRVWIVRSLVGQSYSINELELLWADWFSDDEVEMFSNSGLTFPGFLKTLDGKKYAIKR
jgi:hypothetical protein